MNSLQDINEISKSNLVEKLNFYGIYNVFCAIISVLCGKMTVTEGAALVGVSRNTFYEKMNKVIRAIVKELISGKPGPKSKEEDPEWAKSEIERVKAENNQLRKEINGLKIKIVHLSATVFFLKKLVFDIEQQLMEKIQLTYTRFSKEEKYQVFVYMTQVKELGGTIKEFSKATGKCYRTLMSWFKAAKGKTEEEALKALADKSSATSKKNQLPLWIKQLIVKTKKKYLHWGCDQISKHLKRLKPKPVKVCTTTVWNVLKEYFPDEDPDAAWRMWKHTFNMPKVVACLDFAEVKLGDAKAYLLLAIDETTRYILDWKLCMDTSTELALGMVKTIKSRYKELLIVKTDNGKEFREQFKQGLGQLGIFHLPSPIYYAIFQGKIERTFREFRKYELVYNLSSCLKTAKAHIKRWISIHNKLEVNENLGYLTPHEAFVEGKSIQIPETTEIVEVVDKGPGKIDVKFKNRYGRKAKIPLTIEL